MVWRTDDARWELLSFLAAIKAWYVTPGAR